MNWSKQCQTYTKLLSSFSNFWRFKYHLNKNCVSSELYIYEEKSNDLKKKIDKKKMIVIPWLVNGGNWQTWNYISVIIECQKKKKGIRGSPELLCIWNFWLSDNKAPQSKMHQINPKSFFQKWRAISRV